MRYRSLTQMTALDQSTASCLYDQIHRSCFTLDASREVLELPPARREIQTAFQIQCPQYRLFRAIPVSRVPRRQDRSDARPHGAKSLPISPARHGTRSAIQERYSTRPRPKRQSEAPDFEDGHASLFSKVAVLLSILDAGYERRWIGRKIFSKSTQRRLQLRRRSGVAGGRGPGVSQGRDRAFVSWKLLLGGPAQCNTAAYTE